MTTKLTNGTVNTAQCPFFYVEAGRGPGVVLLHGGGETHHEWSELLPKLARTYRTIAPDLPGCGKTGQPREGYNRTTIGRAIVEFVKALGEERVALVAQGLGAFLAVEVAAATPYLVERLAMISPTIGGIEGTERRLTADEALAERQLYGDSGTPEQHATQVAETFIRSAEARHRYVELQTQHANPDRQSVAELINLAGAVRDDILLQTFRCPTLVIRPEHDPTFSRQRGERVAALIPQGRFVEVPDAGHFVQLEQPEALARVLLPFLQER